MSLGDFDLSTVVYFKFTTFRASTGAPFTLAGTPAISVYKDNSTTQSTTGVTLTVDFDSVTGLNHVAIDTSADGSFYSSGSFFDVVITTGTVDSVSAVGSVVGRFSLRKTSPLKPTTAGRTLDVSSGGEAGVDWANVGSPTTTLNLSGTTIKTATDVETDTADIQTRLPAALVNNRMDSSVGAMASGVLTATAIAADAITDAKVASDVTIASVTGAVGSVTGNVGGNVVGSVASVTAAVTVGTINAGVITAASIATGAIDADALATDAVTEIWAGSTAPTASAIADAVWDEALSGHLSAGSTGEALNAAGAAGDPWTTTLPGSYTGSQAGKMLSDILVDTGTTLQAELDGIQADTEDIQSRLPAALVDNRMDVSVGAMAANVITAASIAADAITDAKVASDVTIASVTGAVGSVTAAVTVGAINANTITAASIAADAITDAKVASDVTIASVTGSVGSVTGNVGGNVVGSVASVTAPVTVGTINAGVITASSIASNALTSTKFATGAITTDAISGDARLAIGLAVWAIEIGSTFGNTYGNLIEDVVEKLNTTMEPDGGVYRFTANALEQGPAGAGGDPWDDALPGAYAAGTAGYILGNLSSGTGAGARTVTITVNLSASPVEGATVRLTKAAETYLGTTNASGVVVFNVDDGTWTVAITAPGATYAGTTLVVDGNETVTYSVTGVSIPPSSSPSSATGYLDCYDEENVLQQGVQICVQLLAGPGSAGYSYDSPIRRETSGVNGRVSFTDLVRGGTYRVWRGSAARSSEGVQFVVPGLGSTFQLPEIL